MRLMLHLIEYPQTLPVDVDHWTNRDYSHLCRCNLPAPLMITCTLQMKRPYGCCSQSPTLSFPHYPDAALIRPVSLGLGSSAPDSSITEKNTYIAGCASFSNLHTCVRRRSTEHECLGLVVSYHLHECQPYLPDEDRRLTEAPDRHRLSVPLGNNDVARSGLHQSAVSSSCECETGFFHVVNAITV